MIRGPILDGACSLDRWGSDASGRPVVSPASVSVSNTSFDHLRHRGRLPLKRRAVRGLIPQMAGMIEVLCRLQVNRRPETGSSPSESTI